MCVCASGSMCMLRWAQLEDATTNVAAAAAAAAVATVAVIFDDGVL